MMIIILIFDYELSMYVIVNIKDQLKFCVLSL